jgi:uncharacterized glyoxalase superfamily protein PhnB
MWLEQAFGFERSMVISDNEGNLGHSEMRFGESLVYVGSEWADFVASPAAFGGKNTQSIHVHLKDGIDARYARARAAGAVILQEPTDQFYGAAPIALGIRRAMSGPSAKRFAMSRARRPRRKAA